MLAKPAGKIEELESIRGVAALLVVFFHMPMWNVRVHDLRLFNNSFYMVDLFFVLSGFVINLNYSDRLRTISDIAKFQFLRFGRLYPVHLLFLLLGAAAAAAGWAATSLFGLQKPNGFSVNSFTVSAIMQQILLVHSLGFSVIAHPLNGPSWSISVEFYTYLLFGFLSLMVNHVARFAAFILFSAASLALLFMGHGVVGAASEILQCFAGFFMGCLVAAFAKRHGGTFPRGSTLLALAAMLAFLCLDNEADFDIGIFVLSAALVLAVVCSKDDRTKAILRHSWLRYLGLISYSIYMSHLLVLWSCNQFVRVVLRRPEAILDGISTPQLSVAGACLWYAIAFAATIGLSALVFKYVEDPFRLKSKEFVRRRTAST
jgi:peptidoglycan/LPS O-acetylase OafA/YrhL